MRNHSREYGLVEHLPFCGHVPWIRNDWNHFSFTAPKCTAQSFYPSHRRLCQDTHKKLNVTLYLYMLISTQMKRCNVMGSWWLPLEWDPWWQNVFLEWALSPGEHIYPMEQFCLTFRVQRSWEELDSSFRWGLENSGIAFNSPETSPRDMVHCNGLLEAYISPCFLLAPGLGSYSLLLNPPIKWMSLHFRGRPMMPHRKC